MSEKILVLVKRCGDMNNWNSDGMNYLKGRIVRISKHPDMNKFIVKSNNTNRKYWYMEYSTYVVITPEIRKQLIETFKKDRSLFVLKDKYKGVNDV